MFPLLLLLLLLLYTWMMLTRLAVDSAVGGRAAAEVASLVVETRASVLTGRRLTLVHVQLAVVPVVARLAQAASVLHRKI